jgi:hypothetical protein
MFFQYCISNTFFNKQFVIPNNSKSLQPVLRQSPAGASYLLCTKSRPTVATCMVADECPRSVALAAVHTVGQSSLRSVNLIWEWLSGVQHL